MRTERDKMLAGELYDALDPDLVRDRDRARDLCQALNATRESEREVRRQILFQLFGKGGDTVWMQPPFFCDYGSNIELGERVFFNFNCVVLDVARSRLEISLSLVLVFRFYAHSPSERRAPSQAGVRQTDLRRLGCLGRWRGATFPVCALAPGLLSVRGVSLLEMFKTASLLPETPAV